MKHFIKILEIEHISPTGEVLWKQQNLKNMIHKGGEELMLKIVFAGTAIPANYYFGLDARTTLATTDTMATIINEPTTNAYARVPIPKNAFATAVSTGDYWVATSPLLTFSATGGSWGPVYNVFMTDAADLSGKLMATVALNAPQTVADGGSIKMMMGLALNDCPSFI